MIMPFSRVHHFFNITPTFCIKSTAASNVKDLKKECNYLRIQRYILEYSFHPNPLPLEVDGGDGTSSSSKRSASAKSLRPIQ
mmetsp:Transcript_18213/g.20986  ORF Transcript_18213/g.20986 Transcript_18213/m.20986 type:complete len:82 (+) Transcript_18213:364-609(+)